MKKRNVIIVIITLLILISGLLFYTVKTGMVSFQSHEEMSSSTKPEHQQVTISKESQAQPEVSEKETEEVPTIEISPEKQQLIGVKTVEVSIKPLQKIIRTVGRIDYDEKKLATINTKFEGWIEKLYVDYTGRYVKKGEPLAEIYSPELFATQQEFINLLKWSSRSEVRNSKSEMGQMLSKDAEVIVEAAKQRLRLWDITDAQIKTIQETGKPIRTLTIYSPVNGYVVQKPVIKGMRVMPGEKLFDVADLSTIWIISDIYEYELPLIKVGEKARISLSYFPGKEFWSRIDYVYPVLSTETKTAKVRFSIPNPGGQLKPQMFANVEVKINLGKKLVIPDDAVIDTGVRQIVYVDRGEGYFEPREVVVGIKGEGLAEVLRGLKAGERVASAATFLIDSEAKLKGVVPLHKH